MSHKVQQKWCEGLKLAMPRYFIKNRVLEVGSLNVNGSLRPLFEKCTYVGVDVIEGPDVDIVKPAHELEGEEFHDVICSVNTLEHDMHFNKTLPRMYELLKPDGLMFISAAYKWDEHGTAKRTPWASGTAKLKGKWADYYKNVTPADILKHFKYDMFRWHMITLCHKDVQFVGIK